MFFFDAWNAVAAREDRKPKYWRLGCRHLGLSLTSHRQTRHLEYGLWLLISMFLRLLISCKSQKNRLRVSSNRFKNSVSEAFWVWRCDVTTSNSIQDGDSLVVNVDLRVQLQHCMYQRKTLLFALIKVSTFIKKREILGSNSPLTNIDHYYYW